MDRIREQFSDIYDQYIEKIYRFVYLKVNSQEIAEDITSKVFLKGWESYKNKSQASSTNFNIPIENPGAFLYQIARNSVIDHYREKARTKVISTENIVNMADQRTNLQNIAELKSDVGIVKLAMQNLKKDYQDVIIWHYLEDISIANVAKIMDKPEGTIRVMLHRGLKELKDTIQEL